MLNGIMTTSTINKLRQIIRRELDPIIGKNTILLDCPYHINIGDTLIWQGELDFLNALGKDPIFQSSLFTFTFPKITKDITICLHGGGNFGDLYRCAQDFRLQVIERYPDNKIVMFPQSVWYKDKNLIEVDANIFSKHKNLYLCARDIESYEFMKKYFSSNNILLVPDMAFFINRDLFEKKQQIQSGTERSVLIKRLDPELVRKDYTGFSVDEIRDWPTFEKIPLVFKVLEKITVLLIRFPQLRSFLGRPIDYVVQNHLKCKLLKKGIEFLSSFNVIYTTRLHAMILGVMLDKKKIIGLDNISGKLSAYYNSWLKDNDNVTIQKII